MPNDSFRCPCGSSDISVFYTNPLQYACRACKCVLIDDNDLGIPILPEVHARQKYPAMYGLLSCLSCSHAPHQGSSCKAACEFCKQPPLHVYNFRVSSTP